MSFIFVFSSLYLPPKAGHIRRHRRKKSLALRIFSSLKQRVDVARQFMVFTRHHAPCIMGVQFDAHVAERVHHGGMMGMRLRQEGHPCHEGEGFLKILESKLSDQSVVAFCPHEVCI